MFNKFRVDTPASSNSSVSSLRGCSIISDISDDSSPEAVGASPSFELDTTESISLPFPTTRIASPCSPTPEPTSRALGSRKRSYFSEDLKLRLVQLCVLHLGDYARRRKGQFWKEISSVFELQTGVPIRKPAQTVEALIKERREQLKYRSGVAESDTELKQAIDIVMARFDDVDAEERELAAQKDELESVKAGTKEVRERMMYGRARSDDESDTSASSVGAPPRQKRSRTPKNELLTSAISNSTSQITDAIMAMAGALTDDKGQNTSSASNADLELRIDRVDEKVDDLKRQMEVKVDGLKLHMQSNEYKFLYSHSHSQFAE
ncbi:hypothetical protein V1525DRAFT_422794 [Lipomyces kononenkoae]|uniref:Uncharacterized protein n=1 Tax=Lipomyces kononenkoae TaxID=34357 RepID=A0ACC3SRU9_LIPKO